MHQHYRTYHQRPYPPNLVAKLLSDLYGDAQVKNRRGIFEYILGGCKDKRLLNVRVFDEVTKRSVYGKQTEAAKKKGISNCPVCATGHEANSERIWSLAEMDADHVTAWSKGGSTSAKNCQMLCKSHNRSKGNS